MLVVIEPLVVVKQKPNLLFAWCATKSGL